MVNENKNSLLILRNLRGRESISLEILKVSKSYTPYTTDAQLGTFLTITLTRVKKEIDGILKQLQFSFTVVYELHKRRQSIHYISPDLKSSKDHGWIPWTRQFWMQPRSNGTEHGMDATRS